MNKTQERVIRAYKDPNLRRPPALTTIAKKARCSKSYAQQTIEIYKAQNKIFGLLK